MSNQIKLALNICTFRREKYLVKNLSMLKASRFFDHQDEEYYGRLHIFVIDNACELDLPDSKFIHYTGNKNTGGSGGFQRGIEEIRAYKEEFTHVIFMDDDVKFKIESFYILYNFLKNVEGENRKRPVAGRMFCLDKPEIQYTAAEKWNAGVISHVEFLRDISKETYTPGKVIYDADAEYGGWWFCCFPMEFVQQNDVLPFFIHCDDVEYGLRCGRTPIIIEGVQVWHETYDKRITPLMQYYDTRNPLFVNQIHGLLPSPDEMMKTWKDTITDYHVKEDWLSEYYVILGMNDFLKGLKWLKKIDPEKHHKKLQELKTSKLKNAIAWRYVVLKFRLFGVGKV